ncbi:hypothetical protein EBAPG3_010315 [Nitrosospira lacus]|uniref:Uncharacterized protein n=1 Tax=Nitrosospira lacus TaxID=1288494 RepID=A0A1W6SQR2_9PROT|nr:hypothetical protein EBAPG3_010315 [Nitrosospira lacus]
MYGRRPSLASIIMVLAFSAACVSCTKAEGDSQQGVIELAITRPATPQEAVWVQVRAGNLPRGTEIRVSTRKGILLGTVSPFGGPPGQEAITHTIPLPQSVIVNNRVQLRLTVDAPGKPARSPQPGEVESINLVYVPISF